MKTLIISALFATASLASPVSQVKKVFFKDTKTDITSKITSGVESVPHSHPYTVGLLRSGQFTCGGSIISPEWIVTAAHCMDGAPIQLETVLVGAQDRSAFEPGRMKVRVAEAIIHEDWNSQLILNDISLIRLATPLEFTDNIAPIKIAPRRPTPGSIATAIGWGSTNSAFNMPSNVLMEIQRPIASLSDCKGYFGSQIDPNMVCLDTTGDQGACSGDSGGPLVVGDELVGAASFVGNLFCKQSQYSAYTGLPELTDWICENSGICF